MVTVRIENAYECGRESSETIDLPNPTGPLEDWWEEVIFPCTGDGHPCGSKERCHSEATILAADDPVLVGQTMGWQG
jgi:hypothetical protein